MNNSNRNNRNNKPMNRKPYEPDDTQVYLVNYLKETIKSYLADKSNGVEDCNNRLFTIPDGSIALETDDTMVAYLVERMVRVDRETNDLIRATCSIVVVNNNSAVPTYYCSGYMNRDTKSDANTITGSIVVTPIGDLGQYGIGPIRKKMYRSVINTEEL